MAKPSNVRITGADVDLKVNWDSVLEFGIHAAVHAIAAAFGKNPDPGGVSTVIEKLKGTVGVNEPLESQAWTLVALCFALALDEISPQSASDEVRKSARESLEETKSIIRSKDYYLVPEFFENPVSLPLFKDMREIFLSAMGELWPTETGLGGKLNCAFNCALYCIKRHDPDLVSRLQATVCGDGFEVNRLEDDWKAYCERLKYEYELSPVFGQEDTKVSLLQLYVDPRATWDETQDRGRHSRTVSHLVDLNSDTRAWLNARAPGRVVRLIRGGPGSGKSSFSRHLAASLAEDDDWRPLLIEMRRLKTGVSLAKRISELFVEFDRTFHVDPLKKEYLDDGRPLVFIFDGLDKLAVPKSLGAVQIAEEFWNDLERLLVSLNAPDKVRAFAVVTGRDAIIEVADTIHTDLRLLPEDVLSIVGLHEVDQLRTRNSGNVDTTDQRPRWWDNYAKATGANAEVPPVIAGGILGSLTDEPLLCYLLALTGEAVESRWRKVENVNEIYEILIGYIWNRVWGPVPDPARGLSKEPIRQMRQKGPVGAFRNQDDFERVLEYVAIAAWHGGESRTATLERFEVLISGTDAEEVWRSFKDQFPNIADEASYATLAVTFFFQSSSVEDCGFEFTHRTFGEYLAARRLVRHVEENCEVLTRSTNALGCSEWVSLTGGVPITNAIVDFVQNAMQLVLRDGMPVRPNDEETWREAEARQRNAEGSFRVCLSAASIALMKKDAQADATELGTSPFDLRRLLERLRINRGTERDPQYRRRRPLPHSRLASMSWQPPPLHRALSGLSSRLPGRSSMRSPAEVARVPPPRGPALNHMDLSGTVWQKSILSYANLVCTSLRQADLGKADLAFANLDFSDLASASLSGACLTMATMRGANLRDAELSGADVSGSDLSEALNLKQEQLDFTVGNARTRLPKDLHPPEHWSE